MKSLLPALALATLIGGVPQRLPSNVIDVAVVDSELAAVPNLEARDFDVRLNDAQTPVARVSRAPANLSVIAVFDGTNSQPVKRYEISTAATTQWIPGLTATDRYRLGTVGSPLNLSGWNAPARGFFERGPVEPSPIWDATAAAVDALAAEPGTRLVLLITDGRANSNVIGLEDVAVRALAANVTISVVGESAEHLLAQAGDPAARIRPDESLRWLAEETGGMYLPDGVGRRKLRPQQDPFAYVRELVATPNRPGPLMVKLTNAVRQRYRLTLAGPANPGPHRIEVRSMVPNTTAHAARRSGVR